jgi:quercetin dioxygenase-like cupin family protein
MAMIDPATLPAREPRPGWVGRFFHSASMTFSYYDIAADASVHRHHHPVEEVWNVVDGELELTIGDTTHLLTAGQAAVVPPDVEHAARAAQASRVIVVDCPRRDQVGGIDIR